MGMTSGGEWVTPEVFYRFGPVTMNRRTQQLCIDYPDADSLQLKSASEGMALKFYCCILPNLGVGVFYITRAEH